MPFTLAACTWQSEASHFAILVPAPPLPPLCMCSPLAWTHQASRSAAAAADRASPQVHRCSPIIPCDTHASQQDGVIRAAIAWGGIIVGDPGTSVDDMPPLSRRGPMLLTLNSSRRRGSVASLPALLEARESAERRESSPGHSPGGAGEA